MDARHCRAAAKYGAQQAKSHSPAAVVREGEGETTRGHACEPVEGRQVGKGGEEVRDRRPKQARALAWPELLVGQLIPTVGRAVEYVDLYQRPVLSHSTLFIVCCCNTHLHSMLYRCCEQPR